MGEGERNDKEQVWSFDKKNWVLLSKQSDKDISGNEMHRVIKTPDLPGFAGQASLLTQESVIVSGMWGNKVRK